MHFPFEMKALVWMGAFPRLEVLIAVRACTDEGGCFFFEVQDEGRLNRGPGPIGVSFGG